MKKILIVHNLLEGQKIVHELDDKDFAIELVEGETFAQAVKFHRPPPPRVALPGHPILCLSEIACLADKSPITMALPIKPLLVWQ